ncbi:MAG: hypothetical protein ACXVJE_19440 [Mucilaginibacter sp.]
MLNPPPHPRAITSYEIPEVEKIILDTIIEKRLDPGYYYNLETGQYLKIEPVPAGFKISYTQGYYTHMFTTASIGLERRATA